MKCRWSVLFLFTCLRALPQTQTCPVNINFANGDLSHCFAYTGNNAGGNGPTAIKQTYDSNETAPSGTQGARIISEYNLSSVPGIKIITAASNDPFGGFPTIPTINGYSYNYSIMLGSTAFTRGGGGGGFGVGGGGGG